MFVDSRRKLGMAPRGGATAAADDSFKERLRRTTEDTYKVDPANPVMKRRDHRKQQHGGTLTEWDNQPRRQHRHRSTKRLIYVLSATAVLVVLVLAGIFWQRIHRPATATVARPSAVVPLELQGISDFRSQVWEVARQFCAAPNAEALIPLIREPERVGPKLRQFYDSENPWFPIALGPQPDLSALEVHRDFVVFHLPLADFSTHPIALEQTPAGFRVDWESFTGYSDLSWAELRRTRPRQPVVLRAVVRPSDYFNLDFPSAATHHCYQISDQHSDHVLYGYVPADGDVELQIKKILLTEPMVLAVLRVRYPQNSTNDRQLEITEVLEKGWIFREDDLPETVLESSPSVIPTATVPSTPGTGSNRPAILPGLTPP